MTSKTQHLNKLGLVKSVPKFQDTTVQYEVVMGSVAYGVSRDDSDMDLYGFAIPPRDQVFPHLAGHVHGFDEEPKSPPNFSRTTYWPQIDPQRLP